MCSARLQRPSSMSVSGWLRRLRSLVTPRRRKHYRRMWRVTGRRSLLMCWRGWRGRNLVAIYSPL
nr:MAG TPA: hypothetical protein [Caudoviricetes sp.]